MRRKLRDVQRDLMNAGFVRFPQRGKGSHELWIHERSGTRVLVPKPKGDLLPDYVDKQVQNAIRQSGNAQTSTQEM